MGIVDRRVTKITRNDTLGMDHYKKKYLFDNPHYPQHANRTAHIPLSSLRNISPFSFPPAASSSHTLQSLSDAQVEAFVIMTVVQVAKALKAWLGPL